MSGKVEGGEACALAEAALAVPNDAHDAFLAAVDAYTSVVDALLSSKKPVVEGDRLLALHEQVVARVEQSKRDTGAELRELLKRTQGLRAYHGAAVPGATPGKPPKRRA